MNPGMEPSAPTVPTRFIQPRLPGLREVRDLGRVAHIGQGGTTRVVDHVADAAVGAQTYGNDVMEFDVGIVWPFDGARQENTAIRKDTIDAQTPGFMAGDAIGHLVRGPAIGAGSGAPAGLVWRVVRNLGL